MNVNNLNKPLGETSQDSQTYRLKKAYTSRQDIYKQGVCSSIKSQLTSCYKQLLAYNRRNQVLVLHLGILTEYFKANNFCCKELRKSDIVFYFSRKIYDMASNGGINYSLVLSRTFLITKTQSLVSKQLGSFKSMSRFPTSY